MATIQRTGRHPGQRSPKGIGSAASIKALQVLCGDVSQYIHDNTEDEFSHMAFINAYLASQGTDPINLDKFRTLPGSKATGAQHIGPLTNLMQLTWITVGGLATAAALKTPIWEARSLKRLV